MSEERNEAIAKVGDSKERLTSYAVYPDPPKSPESKGDFEKTLVPLFLRGVSGDRAANLTINWFLKLLVQILKFLQYCWLRYHS